MAERDSPWSRSLIQDRQNGGCLGSISVERCAMAAGRAAASRQARRSWTIGDGQPHVSRSGAVDGAGGRTLARSSRRIRQLEFGVQTISPVGAEGRVRESVQGVGWRSRLRIRAHRWHHRPCPPAWDGGKRGTQTQAIGRSRGGLTTKIVALVDALGNLFRFLLLPGQRHDSIGAEPLIEGIEIGALIADKGFDNNWLRQELNDRGALAVIPPKADRVSHIDCDFAMYKWRHLVEN